MSFYDDEQERIAEETKHARTGGCIAAALLLLIAPPLCYALMTFTDGGQALQSHAILLYTYYGVPVGNVLPGMKAMALESCELDRTKPANYQQRQAELAETYKEYATMYRENFAALNRLDQNTSIHEPLENIASDINGAKVNFCYR